MEARSELLLGAHLAGLSLASAAMGLHHGLCHVLGGTFDVPHGVANAIILPHAIRFNAGTTAPYLLPAAEAMGLDRSGRSAVEVVEALADRIARLIGQLNLPQRLRDVGIKAETLRVISRLAYENRTVQMNPRPVKTPDEIERLLRDAW
jgi:alcohol dehydrogenase class IV